MKNIRYLQQTERARIEHDLVLTRMGELSLRDMNAVGKGLLYGLPIQAVAITAGLYASPGGGMTVNISSPAAVVMALGDDVKFCLDANAGNPYWAIVIDAADPVQNRLDIIEGTILTRSAYTDLTVDVADPATKVVTPMTRDRDFELYLGIRKQTGITGSVTPPLPTAATASTVMGTVVINPTIDLSSRYHINFSVGVDGELVTVDCRGAIPAATTKSEIVAALNGAGFGAVAAISGD
jgi:hypothetical protein